MPNNKQSKSGLSSFFSFRYSPTHWRAATLICVALFVGCASQTYQPTPVSPENIAQQRARLDHRDPAFRSYLEDNHYAVENWPLRQFDLAGLMLTAMYFNPSVQLAHTRIEIAQADETIAGQRANPSLNFPDEPRDSFDFYGLVVDFVLERKAKRQARQAQAAAAREAAEFEFAQQAWSIYSKLHASLIDYYAAEQISLLLNKQREIIEESLHLLQQRVAAGQVSEFELSRLRLELQQKKLLISNQHFVINDALHRLIKHTGLQADKFEQIKFSFSDLKLHLDPSTFEIEQLQTELLHSRFDIKQKLAEYQSFEQALKLEIEKQYPDVTLSPGFLFQEGESLWVLAAAWTLPLFHNNDGQIARSLAERKLKQYEFIQLQSDLVNELARKKQNYLDRLTAFDQSQQLFSALEVRSEEIEKQFKLGYSDRLTALRAHLEVEKARQAMFQIELEVMRAAAQLEAVTQSPSQPTIKKFDFMQSQQLTTNNQ